MIETERLRLRVPGDADVDAWTDMLGDPDVARYLGPPLDTREAVAAHVRWIRDLHAVDGFGPLAVVRKSDERVIGRSGFLVWDTSSWEPRTLAEAGDRAEVEIGWTLVRDCWGLGYATEAGRACRDRGLDALGLDRIVAVIHPENARSIAVAERLDMRHERDIRVAQRFESQLWLVSR